MKVQQFPIFCFFDHVLSLNSQHPISNNKINLPTVFFNKFVIMFLWSSVSNLCKWNKHSIMLPWKLSVTVVSINTTNLWQDIPFSSESNLLTLLLCYISNSNVKYLYEKQNMDCSIMFLLCVTSICKSNISCYTICVSTVRKYAH